MHSSQKRQSQLQARRNFTLELPLYSPTEMAEHQAGHPHCNFCTTHFYSSDELFTHMRARHFGCEVCQRATGDFNYFPDANSLIEHLRCAVPLLCCNLPVLCTLLNLDWQINIVAAAADLPRARWLLMYPTKLLHFLTEYFLLVAPSAGRATTCARRPSARAPSWRMARRWSWRSTAATATAGSCRAGSGNRPAAWTSTSTCGGGLGLSAGRARAASSRVRVQDRDADILLPVGLAYLVDRDSEISQFQSD